MHPDSKYIETRGWYSRDGGFVLWGCCGDFAMINPTVVVILPSDSNFQSPGLRMQGSRRGRAFLRRESPSRCTSLYHAASLALCVSAREVFI